MNITISLLPLVLATIFQTVLGMFWFGKLFGKQWATFMEFGKKSADEKKEMEKHMPKLYMGQLVATAVSNILLATVIHALPSVNPYEVAFCLWVGFVLTSQSTATIWSQTKFVHVPAQIAIATSYQLVSMLVSTWLITALS